MNDRQDILDYLKTEKSSLMQAYQLTKIGLFGSFAKGTQHTDSDIDLLVEFIPDTPALFEKKQKLTEQLQAVFQRRVDVCREKYLKPYFKDQILSSVVYV